MGTPPPYYAEQAILGPVSKIFRRCDIYEADGVTPWTMAGSYSRLMDGNVSVDYSRDERRSLDLMLDNSDKALRHNPEGFWYDKVLKIFQGVEYDDLTPVPSVITRTNFCANPNMETAGSLVTIRTNMCPNPKLGVDTAGWSTDLGYTGTRVAQGSGWAYQSDGSVVRYMASPMCDGGVGQFYSGSIVVSGPAGRTMVVQISNNVTLLGYASITLIGSPQTITVTSGGASTTGNGPLFYIFPTTDGGAWTSGEMFTVTDVLLKVVSGIGIAAGPYFDGSTPAIPITNTYPTAVLADSPAGYWRFDELTGTSALDTSGHALTGTYTYGYTLDQAGAMAGNPAVLLDGSTGYVDLGNDALVALNSGSVEIWFKTSMPGAAYRGLLTKQMAYSTFLLSGYPVVYNWATGTNVYYGTTNLADGLWHHIVMTFQSGVTNGSVFYIDGVADGAPFTMTVVNQDIQLTAGADGPSIQWYGGALDEAAVYPTILSAARVLAHYNARSVADPDYIYAWTGTANASTSIEQAPGLLGWVSSVSIPTRSTTAPISGTASGKITSGTGGVLTYTNGFSVTAGDVYTVSFDYRTEGTISGDLRVSMQDPDSTQHPIEHLALPLTQLIPARFSITATMNQDGGLFPILVWGPLTGNIFIDNILIEKSAIAKPYFDGSFPSSSNVVHAWAGAVNASISTYEMTIRLDSVVRKTWETQIGEFVIDRLEEDNFPPQVKVTGRDYTKKCLISKFATATAFALGSTVESVIKTIAQGAGIVKFLLPVTGKTTGKDFFFERGVERWAAMKEIATAYGYDIYFDAQGYLVLEAMNDPVFAAKAYTLLTGPVVGNLVSYSKSTNDSRLYNHVVVTGESSDTSVTPVSAEATNTEPSSPSRIARIGDRVYQYTSSFITTILQAQNVADNFLQVTALEEYDVNFSSIALPWLEVGEILEFSDPHAGPTDPIRFLLSSLSISLGLGPMSGNMKRVGIVG